MLVPKTSEIQTPTSSVKRLNHGLRNHREKTANNFNTLLRVRAMPGYGTILLNETACILNHS